jgi:O-antigen/teichoic acid export membrane protein
MSIVGGAGILYTNLDLVMLGMFRPIAEAGQYSAATRLLYIIQLPTAIAGMVVFPTFAAAAKRSNSESEEKWFAFSANLMLLSIAATLFTYLLAGELVTIMFGTRYEESAELLRLIALALPALYLYPIYAQMLTLIGRVKSLVTASIVNAACISAIFLFAVPSSGARGAAYGLIVANYLLAAVFGTMLHRTGKFGVLTPLFASRNINVAVASILVVATVSALSLEQGVTRIFAVGGLFVLACVAVSLMQWSIVRLKGAAR